MYQLNKQEMSKIAPLFHHSSHAMVLSCLQGYMGKAWTDNSNDPKSAQIVVGDFCFFAGQPDKELVENMKIDSPSGFLLIIPENKNWEELIEQTYDNNYERFYRYSIKKEPAVFDKSKLSDYICKLPEGYSLHAVDKNIYTRLLQIDQLKDLCSVFEDYSSYEKHGFGFVIMNGETIVSGASSYTVYDKGIEIEVDTLPEYRRKGLALICASRIILECLERGLYPGWDAMNLESVALSQKLGYHFDKEYAAYLINI